MQQQTQQPRTCLIGFNAPKGGESSPVSARKTASPSRSLLSELLISGTVRVPQHSPADWFSSDEMESDHCMSEEETEEREHEHRRRSSDSIPIPTTRRDYTPQYMRAVYQQQVAALFQAQAKYQEQMARIQQHQHEVAYPSANHGLQEDRRTVGFELTRAH